MNNNQNQQTQPNLFEGYYQQKFLEHASFSEHYARLKMANAGNPTEYYRYAELEYYHRYRTIHYKGLFSAASTVKEENKF
jgi:hypothetical protein